MVGGLAQRGCKSYHLDANDLERGDIPRLPTGVNMSKVIRRVIAALAVAALIAYSIFFAIAWFVAHLIFRIIGV